MIRFVARLALVAAVFSIGSASPARAGSSDYRLVTNPKGYQVEVPTSWAPDPSPDPTIDARFESPDQQAGVVLATQSGAPAPDPQRVLSDLEAELTQQHAGFTAAAPQPAPLPGADAAALGGGSWTDDGSL